MFTYIKCTHSNVDKNKQVLDISKWEQNVGSVSPVKQPRVGGLMKDGGQLEGGGEGETIGSYRARVCILKSRQFILQNCQWMPCVLYFV